MIVVIACLDDFYSELKKMLTRPIVDRVENDPPPVDLRPQCNPDEVERLIARRLKFLYESMNVSFQPDQPTYPLPETLMRKLVGLRARDVLSEVQVYRECCIEKGKMTKYPLEGAGLLDANPNSQIIPLEQAWNEFRTTFATVVPVDDSELATVLADAIRFCSDEIEAGQSFEAKADGRLVEVEHHTANHSGARGLVGVCNKAPQGGALGRQIEEVVKRAGEHTPVIVRSTDFPNSPKAAVSRQLGQLIASGGRRVVVQDSDWRAMMALSSFRQQHGTDPSFTAWLERTRPLTTLTSMRSILDLDRRDEPKLGTTFPPASKISPSTPSTPSTTPAPLCGPVENLIIGTTNDRRGEPVTFDPGDFTRHAAFLGAPGSGKTTAALCVVEQLLLRGVPAILVDRKGDLCTYAREDMGLRRGSRAIWLIVLPDCVQWSTSPCSRHVGPMAVHCRSRSSRPAWELCRLSSASKPLNSRRRLSLE